MIPKHLFGANIRRRRRELGLRQVQVADKCGITDAQISNFEKARSIPSLPAYIALCKVLYPDVALPFEDEIDL